MVCKSEFAFTVTGKTYKETHKFCCTSSYAIYLINGKPCKERYEGSAFEDNFMPRLRVHKIDVINGEDRCGVAKHFLTNGNKVENNEVHLIQQVLEGN